jgi:hypothetical protein
VCVPISFGGLWRSQAEGIDVLNPSPFYMLTICAGSDNYLRVNGNKTSRCCNRSAVGNGNTLIGSPVSGSR